MIRTRIKNDIMCAIIEHDIKNTIEDVADLCELQHEFLNNSCKYLIFEFTVCNTLNAAVSIIIGTLPQYVRIYGKPVKYTFSGQSNHPVLQFMKDVGMYKYYTNKDIDYTGIDVIPFNRIEDEKMMKEYADRIMELAPIRMQKEAQDILTSYIYEIYQNSLFHAKSSIGVFTSGKWDKQKKEFIFSIYDMGIGIPMSVRSYMKNLDIDSKKCLQIAFIDGFSTNTCPEINRGLGLTRIERFIRLNKGHMSIYTEDACCVIEEEKAKMFYKLKKPIKGTLIIINIAADEKNIYIVEKENKHE